MPLLGAHLSIAGGYHRAMIRAAELGCDCVQVFTKNNNQWRAKPISPDEASLFAAEKKKAGVRCTVSHDSYLINLASPDEELWRKSVDSFVVELERAEVLGIPYVVTHPGAYTSSSEEAGLARIVTALDEVHARLPKNPVLTLLENTAGQGSNLGWKFEHLASILDHVGDTDRLGVCIDTCHLFASGYPLETPAQYKSTFTELDRTVGLKRIKAFHLNDSLREFGSRVDRHAHIGEGHLGLKPFRRLLNDPRFQQVPMCIETEKGQRDGRDLDEINLETLRGLVEGS